MELAKKHNVPPYIIFHDSSLREMVIEKTKSLDELSKIYGVARNKLEKYGKEFLNIILSGCDI